MDGRWRFDIQYGPEGEANYAWVRNEAGKLICVAKTHDAAKIVEAVNAYAVINDRALASQKEGDGGPGGGE